VNPSARIEVSRASLADPERLEQIMPAADLTWIHIALPSLDTDGLA